MKNFECSGRTEKCYTITIGRQPTLVSESESYRKIMILKNSQHYNGISRQVTAVCSAIQTK